MRFISICIFSEAIHDLLGCSWEYPGSEGIGCNQKSADDSANLLSFLRELRANPRAASNLTLTAAVGMKPFNGSDGTPLKNVSEYATLLNYTSELLYFPSLPSMPSDYFFFANSSPHGLRCLGKCMVTNCWPQRSLK